jgi:drug/metabolite transporter (DMT)-like permease
MPQLIILISMCIVGVLYLRAQPPGSTLKGILSYSITLNICVIVGVLFLRAQPPGSTLKGILIILDNVNNM